MQTITRRTALAVPLACAGGALAMPPAEETAIMALYRRFCALGAAAAAHPSMDDQELDRLFYIEQGEIEDAIMAAPTTTALDLAVKMLVAYDHGEIDCLSHDRHPLWIEVRTMVGRA
ncbi:hypothetical protein D1122_20635 [Cereibacter sphaeroides]|uniref:hypothetical protein n=1 Tax=Cereibacter sphaeroides TaxID=1063 RepID=UPI000E5B6321|nr:hypothetical protein [Cereibacter sphaeroides]RHZ91862.1 hypothetical protein D1122_20635 [Cereibacter sphaeroides]